MREIVMFPNKVLRNKTKVIEKVDQELLKNVDDLKKKLMDSRENGAGLAAPQIGISKRFFGMFEEGKREIKVVLNPKTVKVYGERVLPMMHFENGEEEAFLEGCMSFPDLFGEVKRYLKIEVEWDEIKEKKLIHKKDLLEGLPAIVWQHEGEHLDGILFVDYIKAEGGKLYLWKDKEKIKVDINEILGKES